MSVLEHRFLKIRRTLIDISNVESKREGILLYRPGRWWLRWIPVVMGWFSWLPWPGKRLECSNVRMFECSNVGEIWKKIEETIGACKFFTIYLGNGSEKSKLTIKARVNRLRLLALLRVEAWMSGVTVKGFESALESLVDEKTAAGEYRFKAEDDKRLALQAARKFFRKFSRKIIELSDGRCVYFAPDLRSRQRNAGDLARCWAEYAFHAVSSSGDFAKDKPYRERWFNAAKTDGMDLLEPILKSEICGAMLLDRQRDKDAVVFHGTSHDGRRLEVVTRVDYESEGLHNLSEVTVLLKNARKNAPPIRPLSEVVEAVERHQGAGYLPSTDASIVANPCVTFKGTSDVIVKLGNTHSAAVAITNEYETLKRLNNRTIRTIEQSNNFSGQVPEIIGEIGVAGTWTWSVQTVLPRGKSPNRLQKEHFEFLEKLRAVGVSHGDFTPWNCSIYNGKLLAWDWEDAGSFVDGKDVAWFKKQVKELLKGGGVRG